MRNYILVEGNLLDANTDFICHQVNCQGKMASGIAKSIRERYPDVYKHYMLMWDAHQKGLVEPPQLLGKAQYVPIYNYDNFKQPYYCINMFAQDKYGYNGKQYTSIEAFKSCLEQINLWAKDRTVAFPWKIGCVRGGANWEEVLPLILTLLTDVKEIYFYRLDLG